MRRFFISIALLLMLISAALVSAQDAECVDAQGVSAEAVAADPAPTVERVLPNDSLLNSGNWYRILGPVNILDAPGGNVIGNRPGGDYFASVLRIENGWAEINEGQWVPFANLERAPNSRLGGILLGENYNPPYTIGWVRENVVPVPHPGADVVVNTLAVLQYTLVYAYADVECGGVLWTQIGEDAWVNALYVARVLPIERPDEVDTSRWVGVDLTNQVLVAYDEATPVFASLVSTGLRVTPTENGLWHMYVRHRYDDMTVVDDSPFYYYMEDVPWTWYFNGNQSLHGAYWHDRFGYRRSHGCVNLPLTSAYWVYNFLSESIDWSLRPLNWPAVYIYGDNDWDRPTPQS